MLWYVVAAFFLVLLVLSLTVSTPRRVWAFQIAAIRYFVLWLADRIGLRRGLFAVVGRRYTPLEFPRALRLFAEEMGPTFIKFGQIIASSGGLFPDHYVAEFQKCLDRVRPFPFGEVERILDRELGAEGAAQLVAIDPVPLASASIAQVHTARLRDGTDVVIKVQRPGIQQQIDADMKIMRLLAVIVSRLRKDARTANPVGVVDDFARTLGEELDFRKEAHNLDRFNEIMKQLGYTDIRAPVPHWGHTTSRVLVMERFLGARVDAVDEIRRRNVDAETKLVRGMRAWFQCVLFHGFFHGDVHAGNLMLLDDGDIGFLDFGIVGRFDDRQRRMVIDYLVAFATSNYRRLAEVIVEMGGAPDSLDLDTFARDLRDTYAPLLEMKFGDIHYAKMIPKIHEVARRHRMTIPKEFVLITKQMLYFDRYAKLLAPELNVFTDPRLLAGLMTDIQKARAQQTAGSD